MGGEGGRAQDEQDMISLVHTNGSTAVEDVLLGPSPLFPSAYEPEILHHAMVFFHQDTPVLLQPTINDLYFRV